MNALPASLPAINWSQYEKIPVAGMVADFKKQLEGLTVPYPQDSYTAKVDELQKTTVSLFTASVGKCNTELIGLQWYIFHIAGFIHLP